MIVKDVKLKELLDDPVFNDAYTKLTKVKALARGGDLGRSTLEQQFGFAIDTAHAAKMIEANGYVTYTMLIKRDSISNAFFENLLITVDSTDSKSAHIIKYNLTTPILINDHGAYYFEPTKEMTTLYNERMNFGWLNCQNVVFPMCNIHGGNYDYDHVFMSWSTCTIAYYHSEWVCTMPGPPDEGGGGNPPPPTPPIGPGGYNGPGGPVTIPLPEVEDPDNCQKVNALARDTGFTGRLNNLKIAAQPPNNSEHLYTVYPKPNQVSQHDKYDYGHYQGPPNSTGVEFPFMPEYIGFIHSHYGGLLSIFSPQDLRQLYQIVTHNIFAMNTEIFLGVVNSNGTAYIIQIGNVDDFFAFGGKYLEKDSEFEKFENKIWNSKYGILPGNSQDVNEAKFLDLLQDLNSGFNVYKANHPYTQFNKIVYSSSTSQVIPKPCN